MFVNLDDVSSNCSEEDYLTADEDNLNESSLIPRNNVFSWVNKAHPVPPQVLVQRDGIVDGTNKSHNFSKNEQTKTILR